MQVTGNLKFDMQPPEAGIARGHTLRRAFGARHVLAAASTREGEEPLILDAFARWPGAARPALLLVPRHPQRFDEVAALATRAGFSVQRRSQLDVDALDAPITADIVLGDSMGEMAMYYAASDIAYIGGSLIPLGGQNLIEACAVGTPVLMGPHTFNFAQATEDAIAAGACLRVADADALMAAASAVLADEARLADMRAHALTFAGLHRGATQRTLGAVAPVLR
ncbi:3-deoxy-D-manno-octulosonic acid transferase [compost metagenome]